MHYSLHPPTPLPYPLNRSRNDNDFYFYLKFPPLLVYKYTSIKSSFLIHTRTILYIHTVLRYLLPIVTLNCYQS